MVDEFLLRDIQLSPSNVPDEEIKMILDRIQSLMANMEEEEALEFQQEAKERFNKLRKLATDVQVRLLCNLNILISYLKKGRRDLRVCKLSLRIHRQCRRDLQNIEKNCITFKNFIGINDEEVQFFNGLTNLIRTAEPVLFEWQYTTVKFIVDNIMNQWIRMKSNNNVEAGLSN